MLFAIKGAGKLICLCAYLHERDRAGLIDKPVKIALCDITGLVYQLLTIFTENKGAILGQLQKDFESYVFKTFHIIHATYNSIKYYMIYF